MYSHNIQKIDETCKFLKIIHVINFLLIEFSDFTS